MKLSVLIPVYNEQKTLLDLLELVGNVKLHKEIVLVDDFSNDGTRELLKEHFGDGKGEVKVFYHDVNKGKGAAICTALSHAGGDYVIVQDADLEYSPHDMVSMAEMAERIGAGAVFGSRFLKTWRSTSFPHYMVNKTLTVLTNILFGGSLTDMETCYKMVRTDIMKDIDIKAERFEFEPEVTAKLLKRGVKIVEVPVSYRGRSYDEGKKIGWRDGIEAVMTLLRMKFAG
ncbi:MAG: glycosyltransferase family 2 protein [Candidatus Omnitrophica bacterium]|nr:glycosyltransferase family 2 protein [Candidatus Omnitrophota bacterium]MDD4013509.1 glycosyltransferase family 2 protein [Candidatus Omnitrophota bacterium]